MSAEQYNNYLHRIRTIVQNKGIDLTHICNDHLNTRCQGTSSNLLRHSLLGSVPAAEYIAQVVIDPQFDGLFGSHEYCRWGEATIEATNTIPSKDVLDDASNAGIGLDRCKLQASLDGIDGEDGHGPQNARECSDCHLLPQRNAEGNGSTGSNFDLMDLPTDRIS